MISDDGIRQRGGTQTRDEGGAPPTVAQFAKEAVTYNNGGAILTVILLFVGALVFLYLLEMAGMFSTTATFHDPVMNQLSGDDVAFLTTAPIDTSDPQFE
jgi:hypothetical protein